MSDQRKPQGRPELEEDELLLDDFADLFAAAEVPAALSATSVAKAAAGSPGGSAHPPGGSEPVPKSDVGLDGEIYIPEVALDEEELDVHGDRAGAAALIAEASESTVATAPPPTAAGSLARPQLIGGVTLLVLGLLLSVSALWMVMGLASQVDTLTHGVGELQQRLLLSRRGSTAAQDPRLESQLTQLDERVNELAVIIEGPMSHLRESSQQELAALALRLDRLERQEPGATEQPLPHEPPPVVVEDVAPAVKGGEPHEGGGGWVINLLSLSSAVTAQQELTRLRQLGVRAEQQAINQGGHLWYRLRVTGFDSYEGAKAYIDTVERQTGFSSAWVGKAQE